MQSAEEVSDLPAGALDDSREFVEMNVLQLLGGVPPDQLGVSELAVSPFAKTRIPMAMMKPQLPTGQVFLNLSDVIVGCKPEHRSELIGCDPTVRVRVPIGLIFPAAGDAAMPAAPVSPDPALDPFVEQAQTPPAGIPAPEVQPAPSQSAPEPSPFSQQPPASPPVVAAEPAAPAPANGEFALPGLESGSVLPPSGGGLPLTPPPEQPSAPALPPIPSPEDPPQGLPALTPPSEAEASPPDSQVPSPLSALAPLGGGPAPAAPAVEPEPSVPDGAGAVPLPPLMPAGEGLAPTSLETPAAPVEPAAPEPAPGQPELASGGWPFDGSKETAPPAAGAGAEVESLEDLPPVSGDGDFLAVPGIGEFASPPADEQTTLRGVFLTDGKVDADRVAAHVSDLPGIDRCVVLGSANTVVGNTAESAAFGEQAARLHANLEELTEAAGVKGSDCFTISTSDGMVSYFAGDGLAIGVKHDPQGFRPGVRERLTVIARELGKLAD